MRVVTHTSTPSAVKAIVELGDLKRKWRFTPTRDLPPSDPYSLATPEYPPTRRIDSQFARRGAGVNLSLFGLVERAAKSRSSTDAVSS